MLYEASETIFEFWFLGESVVDLQTDVSLLLLLILLTLLLLLVSLQFHNLRQSVGHI
jgi:hypothetical protein